MIDVLARKEGVLMNTIQSKALIGIGSTSLALVLWFEE
jgi:PTH1 family peptidyl-tRNA hydrolase